MQLREYLPLVHDRLDAPLRYDACLRHFFHRICLLSLFALHLPHLAEAAFPDAVLIVEVRLCQCYIKWNGD